MYPKDTPNIRPHGELPPHTTLEEGEIEELVSSADHLSILKVQSGDDAERTEGQLELLKRHNGFVRNISRFAQESFVRLFPESTVQLDDCMQEARLGLLEAADRFNINRPNGFLTYARWWMLRVLWDYLHDQGSIVHLPNYLFNQGRPNKTESSEIDFNRARHVVSLDEGIDRRKRGRGEQHLETLVDTLPDENAARPREVFEAQETLNHFLKMAGLNDKEMVVLSYRFGMQEGKNYDDDFTLEKIANHLSLTKERVRQIEMQAIRRLRAVFPDDQSP